MKSWQQFNEDAKTYARDKEAYERATAASKKLKARRSAAARQAQDADDFTERMKEKSEQDKRYGEQMYSHAKEKAFADKAKKEQERQQKRISNKKHAKTFDKVVKGSAKAAEKTANFIKNRLRKGQSDN